jgi:predicted nucleic acid-binding protein
MAGSRSQLVADTSALIGIGPGDLLVQALHLPVEWLIPDVVAHELKSPDSQEIKRTLLASGCQVRQLTPRQLRRGEHLAIVYPRASLVDLLALALAKSLGAILLTGDGSLRAAAEREGVAVHGVLWLLDRLVESGGLDPAAAAIELRQMVIMGTWLPHDEVNDRLRRWETP